MTVEQHKAALTAALLAIFAASDYKTALAAIQSAHKTLESTAHGDKW